MRYGVIGFGAVGSSIGTFLRQAGHPVSVLCGYFEKWTALRNAPVTLTGCLSAQARFTDVYLEMAEFLNFKPDVILICTKTCDSPAILKQIKELNPEIPSLFVSCQNGFDVESQAIEIFGPTRVLRMVLNLGARLRSENEIEVVFSMPHFLSLRPEVDESRTRQIATDLNTAGFPVELSAHYLEAVFRKVILNASMGTVCALNGKSMKEVFEMPDLTQNVRDIVSEGIVLAREMKLGIGPDFLEEAIEYMKKGGDHRPSMLTDIERNRPTENESHCGALYRIAQKYHIKVPVTERAYFMMKEKESAVRRC